MCEEKNRIYSNRVEVVSSVYDVILRFGVAIPKKDEKGNSVDEISHEMDIYMSPQHAKVLAAIIQQQMEAYESAHGEMKMNNPIKHDKQ